MAPYDSLNLAELAASGLQVYGISTTTITKNSQPMPYQDLESIQYSGGAAPDDGLLLLEQARARGTAPRSRRASPTFATPTFATPTSPVITADGCGCARCTAIGS